MPPLTLFNTPTDPDRPHWPWPMPHWPFSMPPLTLSPCPQCLHWPYTIPPPNFFNAPIDPFHYLHWIFDHNWPCPTPRLKFYPQTQLDTPPIRLDTPQTQLDTPQIRLDTPQMRLDTPQIRLDTTLNDKSNGYAPNLTGYAPYPHQRQTGVIRVSLVSKQYHEKHMQQYQLTQQTSTKSKQKNCNITS